MDENLKQDIKRQIYEICTQHKLMNIYASEDFVSFLNETFDKMLSKNGVVYSILIDFRNGTELFITNTDKELIAKNIVPVLEEQHVVEVAQNNFNVIMNAKPKEWIFIQNRGDEYLFFSPTISEDTINEFKSKVSKQGIECYVAVVEYHEKPKTFFRLEYKVLKKLKKQINPRPKE